METTTDAHRRAVMDAWREFATPDPGQVRAVFTPDAEWGHRPRPRLVPHPGG